MPFSSCIFALTSSLVLEDSTSILRVWQKKVIRWGKVFSFVFADLEVGEEVGGGGGGECLCA